MPDARTWWGPDEGFDPVVQVSFDVDGREWRGDHFPSRGPREANVFPDLRSALTWAVGLDARFELIDPLDRDVHGWPTPEVVVELELRAARALEPPDLSMRARRLSLDQGFSEQVAVTYRVHFFRDVEPGDDSFRDGLDGIDGSYEDVWELENVDVPEVLAWAKDPRGRRTIVRAVIDTDEQDGPAFLRLAGGDSVDPAPWIDRQLFARDDASPSDR